MDSRGKKIFRKFEDEDEATPGQGDEATGSVTPRKRLTRSSIKPRLLFPPKKQDQGELDGDEEADTDIEVQGENKDVEEPETPVDLVDEAPETPKAPKFAPASPPTTGRTTRSGNKPGEDSTPMKPARGGKRSPFDNWRQTKNGSGSGHKRPAEAPGSTIPAKRTRA